MTSLPRLIPKSYRNYLHCATHWFKGKSVSRQVQGLKASESSSFSSFFLQISPLILLSLHMHISDSEQRSRFLSQPEPEDKMSEHHCSQCTSTNLPPTHSKLLEQVYRLPGELQLVLVNQLVVPQRVCLNDYFTECFNPWDCKEGSHQSRPSDKSHYPIPHLPCPSLSSLSIFALEDVYKQFFRNHTFVFDGLSEKSRRSLPPPLNQVLSLAGAGIDETFHMKRLDYTIATRLLDFIDRPDWVGKGSLKFQKDHDVDTYRQVDKYRHQIQRIVFRGVTQEVWLNLDHEIDWSLPLRVNWKSLPRLKYLVLDLRLGSEMSCYRLVSQEKLDKIDAAIQAGAENLKGTKLKSLIIYGLCSGRRFREDPSYEPMMKSLFKEALDTDGKLELREGVFYWW